MIRGNTDREIAERRSAEEGMDAAMEAILLGCGDAIGVEGRTYLGGLPQTATRDDVLFCHASPRSDTDPITPETSAGLVAEMLAGPEEPFVVFGHTHLQFRRTVAGHRAGQPGQRGDALRPDWRPLGADRRRHGRAATHGVRRRGRNARLSGART